MLRILANGPFVPNEIKKSRNYYENIKKKRNLKNAGPFHYNSSNRNTDFISSNNNISNYTSINNIKKNKEIKEDYLTEFIDNITKGKNDDKRKNNSNFTFQEKTICNNNINNDKIQNIGYKENEINNKPNSTGQKIIENNNQLNNISYNINPMNNQEEINKDKNNKNDEIINKEKKNISKEIDQNSELKLYMDLYINKNPSISNKKLKSNNSSLDNLYYNNSYINKINSKNRLNSSMDNFTKINPKFKNKRISSLSNKLKHIRNFEKYDTLINNKKIQKAGLEKSISDLENSIKIFKNNKKLKDKECLKIYYDNKKIIINNEINREKVKDYYLVQNEIKENSNAFKAIKNQTNSINEEILKMKNEIEAMNLEIKLINKKMMDDTKLCDKMRKDINMYKNHSKNINQKLKLVNETTEIIEEVIDQMNLKHI